MNIKKMIVTTLFVHLFFLHAYSLTIDNPQVVVQLGHSEWITSVAVSPDRKLIASASLDATIKLWDVASGRLLRTLAGHSDTVEAIAFSPDGFILVSASADKTIKLWDVVSGEIVQRFDTTSYVKAVAYAHDGKIIASGGEDGKITLWDVTTGKTLKKFYGHKSDITSLAFSANDQYIVSASKDGTIKLWEISTGEPVRTFIGHTGEVTSIAIMPNGKFLISGSSDATVKVWNVYAQQLVHTFQGHKGGVSSVSVSSNGKLIASGSLDYTIKVWDFDTKKEFITLLGHKNVVSSIAFLPQSGYLVSGAWDNKIKVWDVAHGNEAIPISQNSDWIYSVAISPDGLYVAAGTESKAIQVWNVSKLNDMRLLYGHRNSVFTVAFSPDGNVLASGSYDGTVKLWNVHSGTLLKTYKGHTQAVNSIAFSPNGKYFVTASDDTTVKLWDVQRGVVVHTFTGHEGTVDTVAFSPDGELIASAGYDRTIILWAIATGKEVKRLKGHDLRVSSIAFSPDGKLLVSGSGDTTVRLWDVASGKCVKIFTGHSDKVRCVTFLPDGKTILSGSKDTTIRVWDLHTYLPLKVLYANSDVFTVTVSKDNAYLVFGGKDCAVRIWDLVHSNEIAQCIATENNEWAVVTPDNYYFCNKGTLKNIHFVKFEKFVRQTKPIRGDKINNKNSEEFQKYEKELKVFVFGFDQFDLQFNRPDIVLERLGKAPGKIVAAYRKAYEKRLQKMSFDPSRFEKVFTSDMPYVAITSPTGGPIKTNEPDFTLQFIARDVRYGIERVFVNVNGVPLFGVKGKLLKEKSNTIKEIVTIPLSIGKNEISISVLNEKGVESLAERIEVVYNPTRLSKPDLYIIGIGVSQFKQEAYNLTYADKDAQNIVKLFELKKDKYNSIKVALFLNEDAIREKILGVKSALNNTMPDDQVIVFVASHGLLDDNLNYYIATHDIDFANPQNRGLRYEELEDLLDGIPARQKLLFIDACHSGELDNDEMQLEQSQENVDKYVKTRGFAVVKTKENTIGLNNSFALMKELFADLRRNNGAVVISSAGGEEYAYESPQWKNGVFTFSIIEGLTKKKADGNKDGTVTVSELMSYVAQRTRDLTGGRQNPTSRKENITVDFKIW
ncbi:MAG: caspase family protein [Spirochaetota bacterium]